MPRAKRAVKLNEPEERESPSAVLLEMIGLADAGRCMACGWPLASTDARGCVTGNCSFRPQQEEEPYRRWHERTSVLVLARMRRDQNIPRTPRGGVPGQPEPKDSGDPR